VRPQQLLDFPYCQKCIEDDELIEAVHVDHIVPLEHGGEPFEKKNLQSLCLRCHVIKSAQEARRRNQNEHRSTTTNNQVGTGGGSKV
jgi:5-methylcytosine-specific restriction enzyme A